MTSALAEDGALTIYPELGEDWPEDGLGAIAMVAAQLPDPLALAPGSRVVVHPGGPPPSGRVARWLARSRPRAHLAVRCTALLARGYAQIGGSDDGELAWGVAVGEATTSFRSS